MKRYSMNRWTALALITISLSLPTKALAQDADASAPKAFAVQIGPIDRHFLVGDAQHIFSTGLHLGASYALLISALTASGATASLDLDYNHNGGGRGDDGGDKGHLDMTGLSLVGRVPLSRSGGKGPVPYAGGGIGYFDSSAKYTTTTTKVTMGPSPTDPTKTITTTTYTNHDHSGSGGSIGGKVLLGVTFEDGFFAEASYIITKQEAKVNPSSLDVAFGIRF